MEGININHQERQQQYLLEETGTSGEDFSNEGFGVSPIESRYTLSSFFPLGKLTVTIYK